MGKIKINEGSKNVVLTKETRFNEISETLDEWTEDEQLFACYYTLQCFIRTMETEQVPLFNEDGTFKATGRDLFTDWFVNKGIREMIHNAEAIREAIGMEIL